MAVPAAGLIAGQQTWRPVARRLGIVFALSVLIGYPLDLMVNGGALGVTYRAIELGLAGLLAFTLAERWPRRPPGFLPRWVLQVFAVGVVMLPANFVLTLLDQPSGARLFWSSGERLGEFGVSSALALLIGPWTALAALMRQKDALVRRQSLTFELQRSELERQALDARLHLIQAQLAPHFLFNTLANVKALVAAGSPHAPAVLDSLIAYLRAAVPRLENTISTMKEELGLVQAYLELMNMRMPDRLQFRLHVDEAALALRCPPMTLLTLVENAVKHGIDPSEVGGRIDIHVTRIGSRCHVRVIDTGVGLLQASNSGLGTGLSTLRERLRLAFGGASRLRLNEHSPHGVCAELDFPADAIASA